MTALVKRRGLLLGLAALPLASRLARGETYPSRPVRIIVATSAGGGTDLVARFIAQWLSERLGQSFVVENRPGGGNNIGTEMAARAPADGTTLFMANTVNTINNSLYRKLNYNFISDFTPVANVMGTPLLVLVHPSVKANNAAELIALAKANPGKLNLASGGVGSTGHMSAELLQMIAGIKFTHVPYRGEAPALTDLIGGHVSMYFSSMPPAIQLVKEGKIRALGVTGLTRSPIFPELPTIAEAALPGYEAVLHYGIIAPAGTPKPYVTKLNAALRQAVMSDELKQKLAADGTEPLASTPEQYAADIDKEETKWSAIVKKSGAKAE